MIVGAGYNDTTSKRPIIFEQTLTAEFTNSNKRDFSVCNPKSANPILKPGVYNYIGTLEVPHVV